MSEVKLKGNIKQALANPQLGGALGRFFAYGPSRAYEGIDFQTLRTGIAQVKSQVAEQIKEMTARFTGDQKIPSKTGYDA